METLIVSATEGWQITSLILNMKSGPLAKWSIQGVLLVGLLVFKAYELGHKLQCAVAQQ